MASQKKKKMTLYQCPFYNSFKPLWMICELGILDDVELVTLDSMIKDTEEYREYKKNVHPHGTIPALVVEGEGVILESTAICFYLADVYGKLAPPLDKRREYYDWVLYGSTTLDETFDFFYWQWAAQNRRAPDPEGIQKWSKKFNICMQHITKALKGRDYICGDSFTTADCIVGFLVWNAAGEAYNGGCLVKDFPAVQAYVKRVAARPGFKKTIEAQAK